MEIKLLSKLNLVLIGLVFLNILLATLSSGGGWDLNEQIAFGNRLANNGIAIYTNGINNLFSPSSPYFPGVGLISSFLEFIGIHNLYIINQLMLGFAVLIGFIYFLLLQKLTYRFKPNKSKVYLTAILIVLYATHIRSYQSYMSEFKPDTVLLVISTLILFLLGENKQLSVRKVLLVSSLLFAATFFKQSSFLVYCVASLSILTNTSLSKKTKTIIIGFFGIIGLITICILFRIDNLYFFCIEALKARPSLELKTIIYHFAAGTILNLFFIIFLLLFLYKNLHNFNPANLQSKYFIFAVIWFIYYSVISITKSGANRGNYEVGIIVFMPYVVISIDGYLKRAYTSLGFQKITVFVVAIGILILSYKASAAAKQLHNVINNNLESIQFLTKHFANNKAFIDGDTYIISKMSKIDVLTEAETAGHLDAMPNYDMSRLEKAFSNKTYDLVFTNASFDYYHDKKIILFFEKNYQLYTNTHLPKHLYGKIFVPTQ